MSIIFFIATRRGSAWNSLMREKEPVLRYSLIFSNELPPIPFTVLSLSRVSEFLEISKLRFMIRPATTWKQSKEKAVSYQ
jgi:hypothetical protein